MDVMLVLGEAGLIYPQAHFLSRLKLNNVVPTTPPGRPKFWGTWTGFGPLLGVTWGSYYIERAGQHGSHFSWFEGNVGVFFDAKGDEHDEPLLLLSKFSPVYEALQLRSGLLPAYPGSRPKSKGKLNRPEFVGPGGRIFNVLWYLDLDSV